MNICCIVDVPDWALANNVRGLQKYGKFNYTLRYGREDRYKAAFKKLRKFDLVLFWVDVRLDYLVKRKAPKNKTVVMVRSDVRGTCKKKFFKYWKETNLMKDQIKCFMVANKEMLKWVRMKYPMKKSFYAPGGVDTGLFVPPAQRDWSDVPRVGWSGSKKNFGAESRGLKIIKRACTQLGWKFKPAYRESRWRSYKEMVKYYADIDLYIDLWKYAGKQNGLLEAMACGVPSVCADKGIARELVPGGLQICNMSVGSAKAALRRANRNRDELSRQGVNFVRQGWSWELWARKFEDILKQIKRM